MEAPVIIMGTGTTPIEMLSWVFLAASSAFAGLDPDVDNQRFHRLSLLPEHHRRAPDLWGQGVLQGLVELQESGRVLAALEYARLSVFPEAHRQPARHLGAQPGFGKHDRLFHLRLLPRVDQQPHDRKTLLLGHALLLPYVPLHHPRKLGAKDPQDPRLLRRKLLLLVQYVLHRTADPRRHILPQSNRIIPYQNDTVHVFCSYRFLSYLVESLS